MAMLKILQVTDSHILPKPEETMMGVNTDKYFRQVLAHAFQHHERFDLMLLTGDLTQDPSPESYRRIRQILSRYQTPCLCLPGNHDDLSQMQAVLDTDTINCDKRKQLGNWQIISLNSQKPGHAGGLIAQSELDYLCNQLRLHPHLYTLIAVHHHCISSGSSWMDTMIIENSDEFLAALAPHRRIKAIICGHVHQALEKKYDDIAIYTTPASCFQFKPGCREFALDDKPPGYRVLELDDDGGIRTEVQWLPLRLTELNLDSDGY
ncbi:3',5'-cyclic-AMP phosphodiesterase [Methylomarinum sp. Ch1-1]|uniref:3',5'-cyclic-AMP phosphodiesterase n=1 Tax=Methylomarinum roseum TaxID=3067653 RepID=A0AAU7NS50_9GAMM|nr:3',5'-cyclic-AMP phosphodiesterase [Methylomarinum sp. Ch1-1]MDP4520171.1 3',5'-cyclic-AMP phosphodiesterase [Methylomarinum sp. Ch1-1]